MTKFVTFAANFCQLLSIISIVGPYMPFIRAFSTLGIAHSSFFDRRLEIVGTLRAYNYASFASRLAGNN
jgi:hypothetical protein